MINLKSVKFYVTNKNVKYVIAQSINLKNHKSIRSKNLNLKFNPSVL